MKESFYPSESAEQKFYDSCDIVDRLLLEERIESLLQEPFHPELFMQTFFDVWGEEKFIFLKAFFSRYRSFRPTFDFSSEKKYIPEDISSIPQNILFLFDYDFFLELSEPLLTAEKIPSIQKKVEEKVIPITSAKKKKRKPLQKSLPDISVEDEQYAAKKSGMSLEEWRAEMDRRIANRNPNPVIDPSLRLEDISF